MSTSALEKRVRRLEAELARLRERVELGNQADKPWWERIWGSFAGDPTFQEVVRLGRHYRKTFRPKRSRRARR